jgi:hypothetical protein
MSWSDVEGKSGGKEKNNYTSFPEGTTKIRVLDAEPFSFWNHWLPKHGKGTSCLGKGCPICDVIAQSKANKIQAPYSSTRRHGIRIWNYSTNQMEIMVQGNTFFQDLLVLHKNVGDITTYNIKVVRSGKDMNNTKYTLLPEPPSEFDHADEVVAVDLAEAFKPIDKDKLLLLMEGKTWEEVFGKSEEDSSAE